MIAYRTRAAAAAPRERGFTLLEMMVAITVFASLAVMAYAGLSGTLRTREALEQNSNQRGSLQRAMQLISRDLRYPVARPVRDRYGDPQPALTGTRTTLTLTRSGWSNPTGLPRSQLQRVQYNLDADGLARLSWPSLDLSPVSEPRVDSLLDNLSRFSFAYFYAGQWLDVWPPLSPAAAAGAAGAGSRAPGAPDLPEALRVRWSHPEYGDIERLLSLELEPFAP